MTITILLIIFVVFILCSALFSGSETALFSLSRARLLAWEKDDFAPRRRASKLMKSYNRTLIALVLGNMFVNIALSITGNQLFGMMDLSPVVSTLLSIFVVIVLLLVFGEVTPKTLALLNPEYISEKVSGIVTVMRKVLNPLIIMLEFSFSLLLDLLGRKKDEPLSPEEYSSYLDMAYAIGAFSDEETELLGNIFSLRESSVGLVMKSRVDIQSIKSKLPPQKVATMIQKERELYYPVIKKDLDDAECFLSARDFYLTSIPQREKWNENATFKAIYIPESTSLTKALREMKIHQVPIALVVDEYGGVTGSVKLRDIYEELVGDIRAEFEQPDWQIRKTGDNTWLLSGQITLQDINEMTGVEFEYTPLNTLNGLFYEIREKVPKAGSKLNLKGASIRALQVKNNRIIEAELKLKKKSRGSSR